MDKEYPTTAGKQLELVKNSGVYAKATRKAAMTGRRPRLLDVADLIYKAGKRGMTTDEISQVMQLPPNCISGTVLTLVKDGQCVETCYTRKTRLGKPARVVVDFRHEYRIEGCGDEV